MGTVARIRTKETKINIILSQSADLTTGVAAGNLAVWVGNNVPKINQVELRTTLLRCYSTIKEKQRFARPSASEFMVGTGVLGAARGAITSGSQAGTWAEEGQIALVYGETYGNPPGASHFIERGMKDLLAFMQERAWAAAS